MVKVTERLGKFNKGNDYIVGIEADFMVMPEIKGFVWMEWASGSIIRVKIRGERGESCRVPLVIWKQL